MLAHHHSVNSVTPAPHPYRTQFLTNLAAVGEYPQLCRKVAIINGVNTGASNTNITPNTTMLNITVKRRGIWGQCGDPICKKIDWTCRSTSNSGTTAITKMYTVAPTFNLLLQQPVGFKNWYAGPAWNNSSLDNAPGSTFVDIFGSGQDVINEDKFVNLLKQAMYLLTGSLNSSFTQHINKFTIVPSYNSADLRFPNKNLYMNWSNEYLCGKTPLDFVYAASENQVHADRNNTNLQYFENEVRCNTNEQPVFITDIIVPASICSSQTVYVEQCNINTNYTYSWSSSNPGILQVQGSGRQVTLNKTGNGDVTISVTIKGCGFSITKQKQIKVGAPEPPIISPSNYDAQCGTFFEAYCTEPNGATGYRWDINLGQFVQDQSGNFTNYVYVAPLINTPETGQQYYNYVSVQARNACGLSEPSSVLQFTVGPVPSNCGNGGPILLRVSPNPTTGSMMVETTDGSPFSQLRIFNKMGELKKELSFPGTKKLTINISDLPANIYNIRVRVNNNWRTVSFIKQ